MNGQDLFPRSHPVFVAVASPPAHGPAVLLLLPAGGSHPNDRRYPIAVIGPGYHGVLTSRSTRLRGLVSIGDVYATALRLDGALGATRAAHPVAALARLDGRIAANRDARYAATVLVDALELELAL